MKGRVSQKSECFFFSAQNYWPIPKTILHKTGQFKGKILVGWQNNKSLTTTATKNQFWWIWSLSRKDDMHILFGWLKHVTLFVMQFFRRVLPESIHSLENDFVEFCSKNAKQYIIISWQSEGIKIGSKEIDSRRMIKIHKMLKKYSVKSKF